MSTTDIVSQTPETRFEFYSDGVLAVAFFVIATVAAQRMLSSRAHVGSETTVVTAFYTLIFLTALLRTVWFVVPGTTWSPYYTPHAVMAFDAEHPYWILQFVEILLVGAGSLCLFSIFILILVYWADILKKYFYPGARRSKPMLTFLVLVAVLCVVQLLNAALFLLRDYSSECMMLVNSVTLSLVSLVIIVEITIFSHRFRTVLKTLGDINQISTESQVKRIVWITVTGNLFFFVRAFVETAFAVLLVAYYGRRHRVAEAFSHPVWDAYILIKHWSELAILGLMLFILQRNFTSNEVEAAGELVGKRGYQAVPETEQGGDDPVTYAPAPSMSSV